MLDDTEISLALPTDKFKGVQRKSLRKRTFAFWALGLIVISGVAGISAAFAPLSFVAVGFVLAVSAWLISQHKRMCTHNGFPVLTYHSVSEDAAWLPWAPETSVLPKTLSNNLRSLKRMRIRVISCQEMVRLRHAGQPLPKDGIVLHFDDGYLDNWVAAEPILREANASATMFISLDFIDQTSGLRPQIGQGAQELEWDGYANWDEIKEMDAGGVFDIQPHGTNHGRVFVSEKEVEVLNASNWRKNAFVQWQEMSKDKSKWYKHESPPHIPYGTPIGESAPSFQRQSRAETAQAYSDRVYAELKECVDTFATELNKVPNIFCWPQNATSFMSRTIADELGFEATTGGKGRNSELDSPFVISRVHAGERVAGFTWFFADNLVFRANIRCFQGNYYWLPVILFFAVTKKLVLKLRKKLKR